MFGLVASLMTAPVAAYPQFAKEFKNVYVGDESSDVQKKIAANLGQAKCNLCHDPKKGPDGKASKKNRNAYGKALAKLLTKEDKKNVEKIRKALTSVETLKAEGATSTFGALLKTGALPVALPATE